VQLVSLLRLSQRALDSSIQGFRLNPSDFTRHVHGDQPALELQHRRIRWLCCSLMDDKDIHTSDFRFTVVALRLGKALHTTYKMTSGARRSGADLAHGGYIRSQEMFDGGAARNLGVIAKQAHEMADAILYWLRGNDAAQGLEFGSGFLFAVIETGINIPGASAAFRGNLAHA